ncbi:hypothetical protein AAES_107853 [Amazona aestiva]|uniref:Ig-like domain-containing protein n=1 Tax=Amazona aestiva TaxID=12930 RepID=A0A0Q3M8M8_AMAAE|nr:hypothetical protein AAES_107853 [Amazona aestiva]
MIFTMALPACVLLIQTGLVGGNPSNQFLSNVSAAVGQRVVLPCQSTIEDSDSGLKFFWYRQLRGEALTFLIQAFKDSGNDKFRSGKFSGGVVGRTASGPGCALLGCLHSPSAGVWAQIRLEETGGGLRAPGDSVLLSCRGYGFNFGTYFVLWYRQAPGGTLEWVFYMNPSSTSTDTAAAVEGRATASRDNSRSETYLSLRALKPQDSARYFCVIYTETGKAAEL